MKMKLKDLGEIITGNTPSKKTSEFWDSADICFVKPDIIDDSGITDISEAAEYISESARAKARVVGENTIFVTCIGSIGKIGIAKAGEYAFNQQINAIIPNSKVNPKYLAYAILFAKPRLTAMANAPVVPIINKSQFGDFEIEISENIDEQTRIVGVLDKTKAIIVARQHELQKLDELIKARFVEMFGTVQDNIYAYRVSTLEAIADECFAGGDKPKDCSDVQDENHPFPVYANGYEGEGLQGYSEKCRVSREAITVSARGTIGYCFIRKANFTPIVRLITIVPNSDVSVEYLKYAIDTMQIKSSGTSQAQLTVPDFKKEQIIVPPRDRQSDFSTFVKQVDKSKLIAQKGLEEAQLLFDSMMQKYFG